MMRMANIGKMEANMCIEEFEILMNLWDLAIDMGSVCEDDCMMEGMIKLHDEFDKAAALREAEPIFSVISDLLIYARLLLMSSIKHREEDADVILTDLQSHLEDVRLKMMKQKGEPKC